MHDPRTPRPEDRREEPPEARQEEDRRRDIDAPEPPGRPEVIREEIDRPQDRPRSEEVMREDLVTPRTRPEGAEAVRRGAGEPLVEPQAHHAAWPRILSLWVAVIAGVLEIFLLFRLALLWAGANAEAGFVTFITRSTSWMVAPFEGIAPDVAAGGNSLDAATIIAMFVYFVAALVIITALRVLGSVPYHKPSYPGTPGHQTGAF